MFFLTDKTFNLLKENETMEIYFKIKSLEYNLLLWDETQKNSVTIINEVTGEKRFGVFTIPRKYENVFYPEEKRKVSLKIQMTDGSSGACYSSQTDIFERNVNDEEKIELIRNNKKIKIIRGVCYGYN